MIKCCSMMNCHTQVPVFFFIQRFQPMGECFFQTKLFAALFRLQFSASFSARLITWQLLKLSKNRTGSVHDPASLLHNIHVYCTFKTKQNPLQFLFSHDAMDSFYDYIWDVTILEYLTRILRKISSLWCRIADSMCKSSVMSLFLNCVQTFTTNEEKLRRDKLL